jgi:hypothetical protein
VGCAGVVLRLALLIRVEGAELGQFAGDVREGQHDAIIARIAIGSFGAGDNRIIGATVVVIAAAWSSSSSLS